MINLKRDISDIKRFKEILSILFEEGFEIIIENTRLNKFLPLAKKIKKNSKHEEKHEVKLRKALERLGPTFIKFGQVLSIRPDFVPKSYIKELEKLQDNVPAFSFNEAKRTIEKSTGKKLSEIFKKINEKPIASASIAQVYKAVLRNGETVAVKVKRPNIDTIMKQDIEIMMFIAKLVDKHIKAIRKYKLVGIVDEFNEWTRKELNFNIETENIIRFHDNFKNSKTTKIPKVYSEYSGESMIIMEFIDGCELHKIGDHEVKGYDLKQALQNGFYSILEQVFIHGLFHADPHPSNILVQKDGKIAWIDFGIVGMFSDRLKDLAIDLFLGINEGDSDKVIDVMLELGAVDEDRDLSQFREKVSDAIYPFRGSYIKEVKISRVLEEVMDISLEHGVKMPREFVLFAKSIVTIEGISLMYYPDFKFQEMAEPFVDHIIEERYDPNKILKKNIKGLFSLSKIMQNMPTKASKVLDKLERGKIKIEMKDTDIERLSVELDKSSNRITYGLIIAALLMSGSSTVNLGGQIFYGMSLVSLLCFGAAGFLSITLFISIMKEKKLNEGEK